LLQLFTARGLELAAHALVPAGFSWMNDARTKPLQGPFTDALAMLHRTTGIDLAHDANFVLAFRKAGAPQPMPDLARLPGPRRITHVCRVCGEHSVLEPPSPTPHHWTCPWCGAVNPLGRPR